MARKRQVVPTYREKIVNGVSRAVIAVYTTNGERKEILLPGAYNSEESRRVSTALQKRATLALTNGPPSSQHFFATNPLRR